MKTYQLILAAALVALASCNKIDVVDNNVNLDNEIGFTAVAKKATKANNAIIDGATYATDNTFNVWGWQSQNGLFTDTNLTDGVASNFMSGLEISWTVGRDANHTGGAAWRNAQNYYYWPFTGKIGFLAVHPSTVAPSTTGWDATNKKAQATFADYTISSTNITTDLMLAYAAGSRDAGLDGQGRLGLVFKHALSQILVKAKTDEDYTLDGVQFDLESVTFNNIDLSGDLAYVNEVCGWSDNTDYTSNWIYYNTVKTDIKKTYTNADDYIYGAPILMIPQPGYKHVDQVGEVGDANYVAPVEGTTLTIGYSMKQKDNAKITGEVTVAAPWVTTANDNIDAWEAGKKYVYTLNFKLKEILFNPSVENWVEVNVQTINILD